MARPSNVLVVDDSALIRKRPADLPQQDSCAARSPVEAGAA